MLGHMDSKAQVPDKIPHSEFLKWSVNFGLTLVSNEIIVEKLLNKLEIY